MNAGENDGSAGGIGHDAVSSAAQAQESETPGLEGGIPEIDSTGANNDGAAPSAMREKKAPDPEGGIQEDHSTEGVSHRCEHGGGGSCSTKLWMVGGVCTMLASTAAIGLLGDGETVTALMALGLAALIFLANGIVIHSNTFRRRGCSLLLALFVSAVLCLPFALLVLVLLQDPESATPGWLAAGLAALLFLALLFLANAFVLLYAQRRGCNALLVATYELAVLCLPAAIHSRNPLVMLPPAFVLFAYLSLSLPLECFEEKMVAMHPQSTEGRPPSPRMLCVCDAFLTCTIWTQLIGAVLFFVGSTIAAVFQFRETQKTMTRYRGHPWEGSVLQLVLGVLFGVFVTSSMVYLVAMVLRNLNPRSRREGGPNQNERENAEREGPEEQTGRGLEMIDGGALSEGDGDDGLHAVAIV